MLRAFTLSLGQLGDAAILRVLAKSLALTVAIFVLLGLALFGGCTRPSPIWARRWATGWRGR